MNIPNSLTILRILLIPVYVGLLIYERFNGAMIVLLVAGVTDALDGTIARAANQRTRLGAFLDPLADKLLLTSGFVTLSAIHLIPSWVTILVVSRDAMLLLGPAVAVALQYVGIEPVDPQSRHRVGIERSHPYARDLFHDNVRHHVARLLGGEVASRPRIQTRDQLLHQAQGCVVASQQLLQLREITCGQRLEMVSHRVF